MTTIDAAFELQCFLFDDALCYDVPHPAKGFLRTAVSKLIVERDALRAALTEAQPAPPHECKTEGEKAAFAFGWWKALEVRGEVQIAAVGAVGPQYTIAMNFHGYTVISLVNGEQVGPCYSYRDEAEKALAAIAAKGAL